MEDPKYDFGKWAELEALRIISKTLKITEMNPSISKYSPIDAIVFQNNKLYPIQIKTRSPRALYRDISLPKKQWKNYQDIAQKNGSYRCFLICDTYNPQFDLDYKMYSFNVGTVKYTEGGFSSKDGRESVFIKLRDMKEYNCFTSEFQQELEEKHIKYIRPTISKNNLQFYKNKFEHGI